MAQLYNDKGAAMVVAQEIAMTDSFTGQIAVPTPATEVTGDDVPNLNAGFMLKAHPDNTDTVWFMPVGRTKAAGFPLGAGECAVVRVANLNLLCFDVEVAAEIICWQKL